jgi:hypothetical protein
MGDVLGIGLTHYPGLLLEGGETPGPRVFQHPLIPDALKDPANWPAPMRAEWGEDQAVSFKARQEGQFAEGMQRLRAALDDFHPDFVVIFGDDQYENFKEDIIPPFCISIFDQVESRPFLRSVARATPGGRHTGLRSRWGDPADQVFVTRGHPDGARFLVRELMRAGFDMPYAYRLRSENGLAHAFINTQLYLDWHRSGWDYPMVPIHINAYGSSVVRNRGSAFESMAQVNGQPDPSAPSPQRLFQLGQAIGRSLRESPWRVAVMGSSSWSHASLTPRNQFLHCDIESDRQRFEELSRGDYLAWSELELEEIEAAGQHELLNWLPLAGAMQELGQRPAWCEMLQSYLLNSSKVLALMPPKVATGPVEVGTDRSEVGVA